MKTKPIDKSLHLSRGLVACLAALGALLLPAAPSLAKGVALDQSFAKGGIWTRAVGLDESVARPVAVAGTPDGGAVALVDQGSWAKVIKLGPSGRPDPAFGKNGQVLIGGAGSGRPS